MTVRGWQFWICFHDRLYQKLQTNETKLGTWVRQRTSITCKCFYCNQTDIFINLLEMIVRQLVR